MEEHTSEVQVTVQLESTDLTVAPGSSVNIPATLHNLSTTDGSFEISVRGIPGTWVSVPAPVRAVPGDMPSRSWPPARPRPARWPRRTAS